MKIAKIYCSRKMLMEITKINSGGILSIDLHAQHRDWSSTKHPQKSADLSNEAPEPKMCQPQSACIIVSEWCALQSSRLTAAHRGWWDLAGCKILRLRVTLVIFHCRRKASSDQFFGWISDQLNAIKNQLLSHYYMFEISNDASSWSFNFWPLHYNVT